MDAIGNSPGKSLIIAIDGPAASGKSTVAQKVADLLGYLYIDTGAMYRAATWLVLESNINAQDLSAVVKLVAAAKIELKRLENGCLQVFVNGKDVTAAIRTQAVTRLVSPISAIAGVRQHLVLQQQKMAQAGAVVMDGRDIGTVVLPQADLKIFLTASPEVRAQRRLKDLQDSGQKANFDVLLAEIQERDRQDSTRAVAPLRQAQDAIVINTDNLTADEVIDRIIGLT